MKREFYREYRQIEDRHWWFLGRRQIILRLLDDHLPKSGNGSPLRLLDVGCGTGTMVASLARYGCAYGVDVDHEAVGYCLERGLDVVAQASGEHLPFPDESVDVATMLDVLEHIADERASLSEVTRVIRPGGHLLVSVPAYRFLWGAQDEVSMHHRRYSARLLRERVEAAGLVVRRLTFFNTLLFPPIAGIRLTRRLIPGLRSDKSDFHFPAPGPLNRTLTRVFGLESGLVARTNLPFGVSILCLAQRPLGDQ
ncbi:MAG: class I SAM-dependent methyltransferase [Chloroflexi bacterium]|nr:MAG: class I SAM-dependent methyltransferase [Chloroflexota bacterium]